jgi:SAM-dependent methyltransferase
MHQRGWTVTGLDISALAVNQVRSGLGLPVLLGSLPHPELARESFDVITMWQSLEHVHDPQEMLRQSNELLVAGGKLLISVPNIDSLPFRWFGPAWYGLDLPRHLTHFSPVTLPVMMERAGFRVRRLGMIRHSSWLRASAQLTRRFPLKAGWRRWLRHKPASRLLTWYGYWTRQSDCIFAEGVKEEKTRTNTEKHG